MIYYLLISWLVYKLLCFVFLNHIHLLLHSTFPPIYFSSFIKLFRFKCNNVAPFINFNKVLVSLTRKSSSLSSSSSSSYINLHLRFLTIVLGDCLLQVVFMLEASTLQFPQFHLENSTNFTFLLIKIFFVKGLSCNLWSHYNTLK